MSNVLPPLYTLFLDTKLTKTGVEKNHNRTKLEFKIQFNNKSKHLKYYLEIESLRLVYINYFFIVNRVTSQCVMSQRR